MAFFIVLDNPEPGFDPFVNGKAIARNAEELSSIAKSAGIKSPYELFSMSGADFESASDEFELGEEIECPPETWFSADEGIRWVTKLRELITAKPSALRDAKSVLDDLIEYERVFTQAKAINAKWHFSIDY